MANAQAPTTVEERISPRVDKVIDALRQAAIPAPAWHLTGDERWRVFRDTLLGHVRVRGSIRPRDLPLDKSCQAVIDSAIEVLRLPAYEFDSGKVLFRHWLAVFSILPIAETGNGETSKLTADDLLCSTIIELCFAANGKVLQDAKDVAGVPSVQRLIGVLGLSQQHWNRLVDQYHAVLSDKATQPPHDALLARWAARVIAIDDPPQPAGGPPHDDWCDQLAARLTDIKPKRPSISRMLKAITDRKCCYVTLKARRPQRYINRGTRHWLLRGASAWCSQSLALARDRMCDTGSLLFSDSDAVVGMWVPPGASTASLDKRLQDEITTFWRLDGDTGGLPERFPRLAEWFRANLPEGASLDRESNLPDLSLWCLNPLSVLETCVYRIPKQAANLPPESNEPIAAGSCSRVIGDEAVAFSESPPWLEDGNDVKAPSVGITSMVWALCGTAFRTHAHEGLCASLGENGLHLQAVHHGGWLEQLRMGKDEPLVHLKMDGDGVGEEFRQSPLADFPWRSMELARMVQHRLVAGMRGALEYLPAKADGGHETLPVDVVYVGGDDVYVIMPWTILPGFLEGFCRSDIPVLENNPWKHTPFSFIAARLEPKERLLHGIASSSDSAAAAMERTDRLAAANLAASRLVTMGLDAVKSDFRRESALDVTKLQKTIDDALAASELAQHGMTATLVPEPLEYGASLGDGQRLLRGRVFVIGPGPGPITG